MEKKVENTPQLIKRVTKELIIAEGHERVTVRRIAQAAGCTYPLLYHYFADMDALFWQLRLEMIEEMIAELRLVPVQEGGPIDDVKRIFFSYAKYYFERPNIFRFFYFYPFTRPHSDNGFVNLEGRFHEMWQKTFMNLVQTGYVRKDKVETVAKTIIYSIQGMILLSLSANGSLVEENVYQEIGKLIDYLLSKENSHE